MAENIHEKNNAFFRQLLFLLALIALGLLIFTKLNYLVGSVLGAITIYFLLRNSAFYLIEKKRWRPWIASLLLMIATVLIILIIIFVVVEVIIAQIPTIDVSNIGDDLLGLANKVNEFLGVNFISTNLILESKGFLTRLASGLLNSTYNVTLNLLMMIIILYFMLAKGRQFENAIIEYMPFKGKSLCLIKVEVKNMIYGNAVGIPLIMIVQMLASALGYWIVEMDRIVFWAFLTGLFGLIPVVGTAAVWLPLSIYLVATGNIWQGLVLAAYSIAIVTNTDNVARMVLMKKMADVHPLIVLFGVILGIPLFGFWGIIFGPLLISGFLLLVKIYFMEYHDMDHLSRKRTVKKQLNSGECDSIP